MLQSRLHLFRIPLPVAGVALVLEPAALPVLLTSPYLCPRNLARFLAPVFVCFLCTRLILADVQLSKASSSSAVHTPIMSSGKRVLISVSLSFFLGLKGRGLDCRGLVGYCNLSCSNLRVVSDAVYAATMVRSSIVAEVMFSLVDCTAVDARRLKTNGASSSYRFLCASTQFCSMRRLGRLSKAGESDDCFPELVV